MLYFNVIIYIIIFISGTASSLTSDEIKAVQYLKKYGYFDGQSDTAPCNFDKVILENALKVFQSIAGLSVTGALDEATLNIINGHRCGMKDFGKYYNVHDVDMGSITWSKKNVTFAVTKYPSYLRADVTDDILMKAFGFMSKHINMIFTNVLYAPDIEIQFVKSIKRNNYTSFDEGSHVTAVSTVPGILGKIYINDEIEWSVKNKKGFSLFRTAVHQIGHILGLGHGNFTSIMSPFVGIQHEFNELKSSDDALNILQTAYESLPKKSSLCSAKSIDTIFFTRSYQYLYVFIDKYFWKMDSNRDKIEFPKLISEKWKELIGPVDAGYQDENGWTYIFMGTHMWKYFGNNLEDGYPMKINEVFSNGPEEVFSD
ncbi:stromelysin-2-like [Arctopsyche grandis]|uniref:stromelysin-2-like n=1 Tax=Arctopsyche grandis TaxID=121162 RepID=UPI00406D667F